jgi:phage baseplate assembly protein gpV
VTVQGSIAVTGDVTAGGKSLTTHVHSGVQPGAGNSGPPV